INPAAGESVNPETLDAFEIGTKSDLLDNRLRVNAAAFHYEFDNLQVYSFTPLAAALGNQILLNAASAVDYGAEASIQAAATPVLALSASGTYTHATYKSFRNFLVYAPGQAGSLSPNVAEIVNASGNTLQRAPKWSSRVSGRYTFPLPSNDRIVVGANWYY